MIERQDTRRLLSPGDLEPTHEQLKIVSVFNPGVAEVDGHPVLLVRVAEAPREQRAGVFASPRVDEGELLIDHFEEGDVGERDPRVFQHRKSGYRRLTFISHLRVVHLDPSGLAVERLGARFDPVPPYESYGVEDPRITRLGDRWWITYVGVSRHGVSTMLASTTNFETFDRHGIIFNTMNKDVVLFPERVAGSYVAIHRPMGDFNPPEMWLAHSEDLIHWGRHEPFVTGGGVWSAGKVGAGCPPVMTDRGWLEIYHANDKKPGDEDIGTYYAGALLLDGNDPHRVLAKSEDPIMCPEAGFERSGFVDNVVFPTGLIDRDDHYLIYYGAADEHVGVVKWKKQDVMAALR